MNAMDFVTNETTQHNRQEVVDAHHQLSTHKLNQKTIELELFQKVIGEFYGVLCKLAKGQQPDLEFLKQELMLLEEYNTCNLENRQQLYQYFLSNNYIDFNYPLKENHDDFYPGYGPDA